MKIKTFFLIFFVLQKLALSSYANTATLCIVDEERGMPVSHAIIIVNSQEYSQNKSSCYEIHVDSLNKTDAETIRIIAMGYEEKEVDQNELLKTGRLKVKLKNKPFYMEPFTYDQGTCDEMGVGAENKRARPSGEAPIGYGFGIEMNKKDGFTQKVFTGIDYFIRRGPGSDYPFKILIYELKGRLPGELIYKSPPIDDYEINWYDFFIGGSWNEFDMEDTAVAVPNEGFLIGVELVISDEEFQSYPELLELIAKGDTTMTDQKRLGPFFGHTDEVKGQTTWRRYVKEIVTDRKEEFPGIKIKQDAEREDLYWVNEHNYYETTHLTSPGLMIRARYEKCQP